MTTNRPPSCDLPPNLKPCPFCGDKNIFQPTSIPLKVHCYNCECYGPWSDRTGKKWNSIPRRSEVLELLRLVDKLKQASTSIGYAQAFRSVTNCADKLRKEIGE